MRNKNIIVILPAKDFNSEEYLLTKKTFENEGFSCFISSDSYSLCTGDNGLKVKADVSIFNIHASNFRAVIFIGGNGIRKYWDNVIYQNIAKKFACADKIVAAICAAPVILSRAGLLKNKNSTCFPIDKKELEKGNAIYSDSSVVVDGKIITGQSSSNSVQFSQTIIQLLLKKN